MLGGFKTCSNAYGVALPWGLEPHTGGPYTKYQDPLVLQDQILGLF